MKIKKKISDLQIVTHFHPIISIKDNSIIALEALSRFKYFNETDLKSIQIHINSLKSEEELLKLDIKLINTTAQTFNTCLRYDDYILLFLNISSALVNKGIAGIEIINTILKKSGIPSKRVVLEILEKNLDDTKHCLQFFSEAKKLGYSLALDDVGVGHSNLQRIAQVKPDIIKLDRSLISNLHNDYYKKKVFNSLAKLGHDIGSIVVAEGVENEKETMMSLELGASLVQGFHFCRPDPSLENIFKICKPKIEKCKSKYKNQLRTKNIKTNKIKLKHIKIIEIIAGQLSNVPVDKFDSELSERIKLHGEMECLFVLDSEGIQVSETLFNYEEGKNTHLLFKPAVKGADHSLKPFYIEPNSLNKNLVTRRYISQASGKPCRTFSVHFYNEQKLFILCIDYSDNIFNTYWS